MNGKRILVSGAIAAVLAAVPMAAFAHAGENALEDPGMQMMQSLEDRALGSEAVHEEMEALMDRMMKGVLSDEEAEKLSGYMNSYPGPMSMMMGRMMMGSSGAAPGSWSMMGGWGLLGSALAVVWLGAGILLIAWLARAMVRKEDRS